jgi:hypothetical protein
MRGMLFVIALSFLVSPAFAQSYLGPGAGISAFGSLLVVLATICFAVVGFVWYPLKRILKIGRQHDAPESHDNKLET